MEDDMLDKAKIDAACSAIGGLTVYGLFATLAGLGQILWNALRPSKPVVVDFMYLTPAERLANSTPQPGPHNQKQTSDEFRKAA
jgi:hypothetical protein